MCHKAFGAFLPTLNFVPVCFVTNKSTNKICIYFDDDPETIIHVRLMVWCNIYKQSKEYKKDIRKELILVAWNPTRW